MTEQKSDKSDKSEQSEQSQSSVTDNAHNSAHLIQSGLDGLGPQEAGTVAFSAGPSQNEPCSFGCRFQKDKPTGKDSFRGPPHFGDAHTSHPFWEDRFSFGGSKLSVCNFPDLRFFARSIPMKFGFQKDGPLLDCVSRFKGEGNRSNPQEREAREPPRKGTTREETIKELRKPKKERQARAVRHRLRLRLNALTADSMVSGQCLHEAISALGRLVWKPTAGPWCLAPNVCLGP